jgi:hypothetical protein
LTLKAGVWHSLQVLREAWRRQARAPAAGGFVQIRLFQLLNCSGNKQICSNLPAAEADTRRGGNSSSGPPYPGSSLSRLRLIQAPAYAGSGCQTKANLYIRTSPRVWLSHSAVLRSRPLQRATNRRSICQVRNLSGEVTAGRLCLERLVEDHPAAFYSKQASPVICLVNGQGTMDFA